MAQQYYTTSQAAGLLAVSPDTVLKWVRLGKIASYKTPGGHARIPRTAVETLLPSQPKVESGATKDSPYHYCWEFYNRIGVANEECEDCVVFRSRARRCYEMRDIPDQFGPLKLHCKTACKECEYYHQVRGVGTSVLVLARNRRQLEALERDSQGGDVQIRFAGSEYECSALITGFRPDYVVLDCAFGQSRINQLCGALSRDERIPFTKIILTSENKDVSDCHDGRIFGWIKKPFSFRELRCCLGQAE